MAFTDELADDLIKWISDGKTLLAWCREPGRPSHHSVYRWIRDDNDFAQKMNLAREIGADAIADECMQIADTMLDAVILEESGQGTKTTKSDALGHRKLQIDTRLKLLAKWHPKKYGDKIELSGDKEKPLSVSAIVSDLGGDAASLLSKIRGT